LFCYCSFTLLHHLSPPSFTTTTTTTTTAARRRRRRHVLLIRRHNYHLDHRPPLPPLSSLPQVASMLSFPITHSPLTHLATTTTATATGNGSEEGRGSGPGRCLLAVVPRSHQPSQIGIVTRTKAEFFIFGSSFRISFWVSRRRAHSLLIGLHA
jgi:hypothetical protein